MPEKSKGPLDPTFLAELPGKALGYVEVGSYSVPVTLVDLTPWDCYGCATDEPEPAIWINSKSTLGQRTRTLVHETIEVSNFVYDLGLTETHIRILEQTICQAFNVRRKQIHRDHPAS